MPQEKPKKKTAVRESNPLSKSPKAKVANLEKRWEKQASRGRMYSQEGWGEPQMMSKKDIRGYERQRKKISKAIGTPKEKAVRKKYDYDIEYANKIGFKPDETGHRQSRDPQTGRILKGEKHPTFYKTKKIDKALGYKHKRDDEGNIYSYPKKGEQGLKVSKIKKYKTKSGKNIYKRSGSLFNGTL